MKDFMRDTYSAVVLEAETVETISINKYRICRDPHMHHQRWKKRELLQSQKLTSLPQKLRQWRE